MVTALGIAYLVVGILSFVIWAYGVVSFMIDVRRKFIPAIKSWLGWRDDSAEDGPTLSDTPSGDRDAVSEFPGGTDSDSAPGSTDAGSEAIVRPNVDEHGGDESDLPDDRTDDT